MKVGDLVKYKIPRDRSAGEQTGVITHLRRNSMNSSDKYSTFYVYWSDLGYVECSSYSDIEVINGNR